MHAPLSHASRIALRANDQASRLWQPGDPPEAHPLWQEQIDLEVEMVNKGIEKFRSQLAVARDPGTALTRRNPTPGSLPPEMTRIRTYHNMVAEMVPGVAKAIKVWLTKCRRQRGARAVAFEELNTIDPETSAFIALRTIMDGIGQNAATLIRVAQQIGIELEYQARMDAWVGNSKEDQALFYSVQSDLRKQKATSRHVRRVNINRFNKLMKEKLRWDDWSMDLRRAVGFRLIDAVVVSTGLFKVVRDPAYGAAYAGYEKGAARSRRKGTKITPPYVVIATDKLMEAIEKGLVWDEVSSPFLMPALIPPRRWTSMREGGYYTPTLRHPSLIRFKSDSDTPRAGIRQEYDALDMPRVYSALHYIQEVPWMVNRRVYSVAIKMWEMDLAIANLPKQDKEPLPAKPPGMSRPDLTGPERKAAEAAWAEANPKALKDWKAVAAKVYGENARRVTACTTVRETLNIATRFINRTFYFPHMLDFRGRMYPIPNFLQPQGNDLARGLLTFAKGVEVGEEGGAWLAVHLANHFGVDKVSYEERCDWVEANEDLWRSIAADPLRDRRWITMTGKKHHWQALAAVFEWVRYLDEGPTMVSSLPIHVDGTCNGIQHLAAMMRDEETAAAVNLIPSDTPRDIYQDVADKLQARLEGITEAGGGPAQMADLWLSNFPDRHIPRSFTKTPVMVLPYGATTSAYYDNVTDWVRSETPKGPIMAFDTEGDREHLYKKVFPYIIKPLWDIVEETVPAARECMEWIKSVAEKVAETEQPIIWRTPTGFVVRHFYGLPKERKVETQVDGKRITLKVHEYTNKLAIRKQLQGISPNFVHSMDASANMETIIKLAMSTPGHLPVTSIHDDYGTVAGGMWHLWRCLREAFIKVHSHDVLNEFRQVCVLMYRDWLMATREEGSDMGLQEALEKAEREIPQLPKRGTFDVRDVAGSDYFFG